MSTQLLFAEAQAIATLAIRKQVLRCNESQISTRRMRLYLARSLGVTKHQAHLLVNEIIVKLCEQGVLEFWSNITRGKVYKIDTTRLREVETTVVTL